MRVKNTTRLEKPYQKQNQIAIATKKISELFIFMLYLLKFVCFDVIPFNWDINYFDFHIEVINL